MKQRMEGELNLRDMPMDYDDDNDFHIYKVHLVGEGSSTVSPVLRPYDYDDSLQGHLRFDSLVENEVFLGITGREDSQWIEEYSRGSSGIDFSSRAAESRRNNVWSEATSSESVKMLLKSVGEEEEGVLVETVTEDLGASDEPGSLATNMDPILKQDDGTDHVNKPQDTFSDFNASVDCEKSHDTITAQSQEAKISRGELDSVVLHKEKINTICDDVNQEAENIAVELCKNKLQEDLSTSRVECGDTCSEENIDASNACDLTKKSSSNEAEYSIKNKETSMDNPLGSHVAVKASTYIDEKPSVLSNVECLDKPLFEVGIPVNDESTGLMPTGSSNLLMTEESRACESSAELFHGGGPTSSIPSEAQEFNDRMHEGSPATPPVAVEDDNTKSEILASPESNASSPSKVSDVHSSIEEPEKANGRDAKQATPDGFEGSAGSDPSEMREGNSVNDVDTNLADACSPAEMLAGSILNTDLVASDNTQKTRSGDSSNKIQTPAAKLSFSMQEDDEVQSSEQGGIRMDPNVTFNEGEIASLPSDCDDMEIEVVGALDSQQNVESTTSAQDYSCKAQGSEAALIILAEPVAAVKADMVSSPGTSDRAHSPSGSVATYYIDAKSCILGVSSTHHDNEKTKEEGMQSDGTCENESSKSESMVDCVSEGPLAVVEKCASLDRTDKVVHEMYGLRDPPVKNINDIMTEQTQEANSDGPGCSTTSMRDSLSCDSSAKVGDNDEAGGLQEPKDSTSGHHITSPLSSTLNMSAERQASIDVLPLSESDDSHMRHDEDKSASVDKLQSVSSLNTNAEVVREMAEGAINEKVSLPEVAENVKEKVPSFPSNSDIKRDKSFTFEVVATAGLEPIGKGQQLLPAIQACNLSTNTEGSCINSSSSILEPNEVPPVTPQTPSGATIQVGAKGNSERKTRMKSGKESVKKGNCLKETTPIQSGRVEKSSALLTSPAVGHVLQFDESKPKEKVECSITKPNGTLPFSDLPDLNNATSIFQQPFTDNQQVQLRAQILVYGSLISGTSPEEPHMIAAFGQSDAGRKTWEAAWRACVERVHGQQSQASTPGTPMKPRSDLKDVGHRTPDPEINHSSLSSKVLSSPIGGVSNNTPPALSPMIPLPSPLWNMSTPSSVGFPTSGMPRSALLNYQQSFSPLNPYQTPPVHNLSGHNPLWLSQSPFAGQWLASSSVSALNSTPRFSTLPITEAVKLTPVKVSGGPGIKHTYPIPVVHSTSSGVFPGVSFLSDAKKTTLSSTQVPSDSKSRKRKKGTASVTVPSQALMASVTALPIAHLSQVPCIGGPNRIPVLLESQTDSVTAPVVSSIFSTSVTVSTPASITSDGSPFRFLSFSSTHDHHKFGDKKAIILEDTMNKVEESKMQAEDAAVATKTWQPSSDSKSTKRKKVTNNLAVNQTSVPRQAPVASVTAPAPVVAYLPQVLRSEAHNQISLLAEKQTNSVTDPAFPTPVAMSTPVSITSSSPGRFLSTPGYPKIRYQNIENAIATEKTTSNVKESKLQAENAALLAATEVSNCQDVWSRLERQRSSGVVSDAEAKLMSSVVSITAAASVAKMAAAAAKIASDVAEQARLMADEVFLSSKTENFDQSSILYHSNVVNKATPASISKGVGNTNHPNPIISVAREAARRRVEAASTASKHAENLDAIVKAAELAAEAVSQVGKIGALGDSSSLRKLAEAGPEGYWKISHQGEVSGHLNSNSAKKNVEAAPNLLIEEIQTLKRGPVYSSDNQMMVIDGSVTGNERGTRIPRPPKVPKLSKAVCLATETDTGPQHNYAVDRPQSTSDIWEEHNIKEGCLVEVYKEDGKYKGAWLAANVLSLKDDKALVCYTEIQSSDEESEKLKEWVALEVEVPRIRIAHPMTTMRFEGTRKRRRTAVTDYAWSNGDRADVWMQDCWREGVVMETNKNDITSLAVNFPVLGETSVVRSWNVRPNLIWKDRKWIEWSSLKGGRASEGETPKKKRIKLDSPAVEDIGKDKFPENIDVVESRRQELPLSTQESSFTVGKSTTRDDNKLRTMRSGLQKEGARVVFGVPKPGKKQKFMEVSKHYVADGSNKNNTTNDSIKFSRYLKPQAPSPRGWKNNSKNDALDAGTKSRLNSRKPPVPSFRTLTHKDNNLISSKSTTHDSEIDRSDGESVENLSSHGNKREVGSSSTKRDATKGLALDAPRKAFTFTSKPRSEHHFNKGKLAPAADGKTPKVEVKDKSIPEVNETRRSNRKIQPTSRLLEGLQSSLTISKSSSVSHASQRNHNKVMSKGYINRV